jgi:hypothetical protein
MAFIDDFREQVIPEMRTEARRQALALVTDTTDYRAAYAEVLSVGIDSGALRLPEADFRRLEAWTHDSLSQAIEKVAEQARAAERIADRVGNQIDDWLLHIAPSTERTIEREQGRSR